MTSYVRHSACNGSKPRQLMGAQFFYRNTLLARMMFDRTRVRYLVAPTGFGKTMLMGSYAQLVADYEGVLWLNAQNPCFLRDLDAGQLASVLIECSDTGGLIVIDDVPALPVVRRRALWGMCQELIGAGREVLLGTTPAANPLHAYEKSCLVLRPDDFLYTAEDFEELRNMEISARHLPAPSGIIDLVACTALRATGSYERFLADHIRDLDNTAEAGLSFAALALEQATFDELSHALGREVTAQDLAARDLRPFVRIDEFGDEFDALGFPLREVIRAFAGHLGPMAQSLGMESASDLVLRLVNALFDAGNTERAAQLMVSMSVPAVRAAWLKEHQHALFECGDMISGEVLFESLRGTRYYKNPVLRGGSSARRCLLADVPDAFDGLREVACSVDVAASERIFAASVALACGADGAVRDNLAGALSSVMRGDMPQGLREKDPFAPLWKCGRARGKLPEDAVRLAAECASGGEGREEGLAWPTRCLLAACLVRACSLGLVRERQWRAVADAACDVLAQTTQGDPAVYAVVLVRALGDAPGKFPCVKFDNDEQEDRCTVMESSLEVQAAQYVRTMQKHDGTPRCVDLGLDAVFSSTRSDVPLLGLNVFGRFDVRQGGESLGRTGFRRTKVRVVLALLALECGRDLSCEMLSTRLWPDSSPERARHNLFCVVSLLRKAIRLPDGECPYIRRGPGVIGLDQSLVHSDIFDLETLCRKLRFDEPNPEAFMRILEQVRLAYRGELLPGEDGEPLIVSARAMWLEKIVASLMSGARRMAAVDGHVALQLAQHALELDPRREDVYEALMGLQAECGQRPAAIDTWFTYCRYIDDELGLDPAPRVKDLYNRIISD